jgi:hypothetical protein
MTHRKGGEDWCIGLWREKDKDMDGSIISKRILTKSFGRMCTTLICLETERSNGLL